MKRSLIRKLGLALLALITPALAWAANPTPVLLVDFGANTPTDSQDSWISASQTDNKNFTKTDKTSSVSMYLGITNGNNFNITTTSTFSTAETFANPAGTASSGLLAEMKATLGLTSDVPSEVWADGMYNGQASQTMTITISGLATDSSKCYTLYAIYGATGKAHKTQFNLTGYDTTKTPTLYSVEGTAEKYTKASGLSVTASAAQTVFLVRVHNLYPNSEGKIIFTTVNNYPGINCLALAETDYIEPPVAIARTLESAEETWSTTSEWTDGVVPSTTSTVELTVTSSAGSTLTLDTATTVDQLTIGGDYALTVTGKALTVGSTTINTNTDVSGITANLGAVTIGANKTLTVASDVTITSLSGTGTLHVVGVDGEATGRTGFTIPAGMTLKTSKNVTLTNGVYSGAIDVVSGNLALSPTNTEGITGTLTIRADATFTNTRASDAINYRGNMGEIHIYGTLNLGSTRWTAGNTTINVYGGATITGIGDSTGALDYHANATLNIKSDDTISDKEVIIAAVINTKNNPKLTINVDEGMSASFTQNIKMGQPIQKTGAGAATVSGVISGTAQIQVAGGTLTLTGANTHTGTVEISSGAKLVVGTTSFTTNTIANAGTLTYTSADATPTNTFTGTGTITADGCTLDLAKDADVSGYTGTFALTNNGTLVIPAGSEGEMTIPAGSTLKLVIADNVDEYDASAVSGEGTFMFVDSTGAEIEEGVTDKVFTRPVSTEPVCMGENAQYYTSIAAAIEAGSSFAMLVAPVTEDVTLTSGFSLQTYGQTITGNVTVASGATLVAQAGGIVGTLTFQDGAAMTVEGAQDFTVSSTVTFPTSGTFNLTMPSAPVIGNSLPFIVSNLALEDDDVEVGTLSFTVSGGTANTTDYKLISTSSGMYEVATVATPSCTLDGTVYGSLADAIAAVSADDYTGDGTITLSESANLTSTLTIDIGDENELTIDLAGKGIACYAQDADSNFIPAIIVESGKLNLISGTVASVVTYTTTIIVGTETSTAPALVVGENVTVTSYGYGSATDVVKGSIGGSGALLTGGDTALALAAGTTIDATEGPLTLSNNSLLGATATVTVKVADTAKADDVIINCDTTGLTANMFAVSGAENLTVAFEDGEVVLADATPAEPIVQIDDVTYTSLADALAAIQDGETLTLLADIELTDGVTIEKSITLAIGDCTLTIPEGTTVSVAADKTLTVTCGAGGLAVDGKIAVNGTLDVSALAYGDTGLLSGKAGSLAIGATGTVKLMSSWNNASVNWMQANSSTFFSGTVSGAKVDQGGAVSTYNGTTWLKADATVTATITANGQTYTEGFATLSAAAAANPSAITLLANTEVTANATIKVPVKGKFTVTVKNGATLELAAATFTGDATKTFADKAAIVTEAGTIVKLTSGGGYFNITGEGTVQAVGDAAYICGVGGGDPSQGIGKTEISANILVPEGKALNVRAWDKCNPLGGGNIIVDGSIVRNGGDDGKLKVTVAADKTLSGTGKIDAPVTLAAGAAIDASAGAVTVTGAVTLPTDGTVTATVASNAGVDAEILKCSTADLDLTKITIAGVDGMVAAANAEGSAIVLAAAAAPVTYVAQVGETKYETLQKAYDAAATGATITLLGDAEAPGIKIEKSIVLDLNDCTLTLTPPPVGSTGTETLGMQILKTTESIIIKDGTIDVCAENADAEKPIKMLIQNYSQALTLTNVILDGTNLVKPTNMAIYVLSNNQGDVTIGEGTEIVAPKGAIAFDVCKYASYDAPTVTVKVGATIGGTVEVDGGTLKNESETALDVTIVSGGTVTGKVEVDADTYEIKIGNVYCTEIVCDEGIDSSVAAEAAELFTGITETYVDEDGDTVADIDWDFGISDIKVNRNEDGSLAETVTITAKVQKNATTAAGYANGVTVVLVDTATKDDEATIASAGSLVDGVATFKDVSISDLQGKKLKVKATK